jgi:hypothetical protein
MDYVSKFNDTLIELVDDLIVVFPNDGEFRMYKMAIKGAMIADKTIVHKVFHEQVCNVYGDKILARDEAFFMNSDYDNMKQEFSQADSLIKKLKDCWNSLTEDQRAVIWKYLRILLLLDNKIQN